jgi:hypothetical protein
VLLSATGSRKRARDGDQAEAASAKRSHVDDGQSSGSASLQQTPLADLDSHCAFGDFEDGEWVSLAHSEPKEPDVTLWRAKILRSHSARCLYDLYIRELVKEVRDVHPSKIFKRSLHLPAV